MEVNVVAIRDLKSFIFYFCFNFQWPKDIEENLKHGIEFIIKSNESFADNEIKNEIEQFFSKYKHGNDINKHRKQQNE